jgi:hypothetical protein
VFAKPKTLSFGFSNVILDKINSLVEFFQSNRKFFLEDLMLIKVYLLLIFFVFYSNSAITQSTTHSFRTLTTHTWESNSVTKKMVLANDASVDPELFFGNPQASDSISLVYWVHSLFLNFKTIGNNDDGSMTFYLGHASGTSNAFSSTTTSEKISLSVQVFFLYVNERFVFEFLLPQMLMLAKQLQLALQLKILTKHTPLMLLTMMPT